jgi:hypothetical protein
VSKLQVRIFDGTRQLFSAPAKFLITVTDGNRTHAALQNFLAHICNDRDAASTIESHFLCRCNQRARAVPALPPVGIAIARAFGRFPLRMLPATHQPSLVTAFYRFLQNLRIRRTAQRPANLAPRVLIVWFSPRVSDLLELVFGQMPGQWSL